MAIPLRSTGPANTGDDLVRVSAPALIRLRHGAHSLPLRSNRILGTMAGPHLSAFKGRGMEFDETRPYQPGDDVRSLHWRIIARTGKPHTKLFREERERSVLLWVDYRTPMWFATRGAFKAVLAARAAALLAWSAADHGDRVGGLVFSERGHLELRPRLGKKAVLHLIRRLAEPLPDGEPQPRDPQRSAEALATALGRLRHVSHPGSLVFLLSDFRDLSPRGEAHLAQLARHSDLVMLFVHDRLERELPQLGRFRFSDGRTSLAVDAGDRRARERHQAHFAEHEQRLRTLCERHRIYLLPCASDVDLVPHLRTGLGLKRP
jgi:uncharacterized protein (DUF58 family)